MNSRQRLHAVIEAKTADRTPLTPIVMAWAAGHVGHSYRDYYLDSKVLAKAQLAAAADFGFDQVSAISDPWREASGYGMEFDYPEDSVGHPKKLLLESDADFKKLKAIDIQSAPRMIDRVEAVRLMRGQVKDELSVLGWVEGPFAIYCDLRGVQTGLMDLIEEPGRFTENGEILIQNAAAFAKEQIKAGADMIGVGDAACSLLSPDMYRGFVFELHKRLFDQIHKAGAKVKLHICGNISAILPALAQSGADVIDADWMVDLGEAVKTVGGRAVLCGNIDPVSVMMQGTPETVRAEAKKCIEQGGDKFILMPGCEVPIGTSKENMAALHEAAAGK